MGVHFTDLSGQRFGRLTVIKRIENKGNKVQYLCRCDCGKEKAIIANCLRQGSTQSCGCLQKERSRACKKKFNQYNLNEEYGIGYSANEGSKFYFDLKDYDKIKDVLWNENKQGYLSGALPREGRKKSHMVYLHRLVMDCPDDMQVDHINCDARDNRKANLRICTREENNYFRTKEYKYKGIGKITNYFLKDYPELGGFETKDKALEELNKIKERENI